MNFPDDLQMIPCLLNYPIPQFARMQSAKLLTSESAAGRLTYHRLVTQRINHEIRKVAKTKALVSQVTTRVTNLDVFFPYVDCGHGMD